MKEAIRTMKSRHELNKAKNSNNKIISENSGNA